MVINLLFETNVMTLQRAGSALAQHLPCQLDTVNIPLNLEVQGSIPTDWYDLYSIGWTSPVPQRGDYFIDEATSTHYSVFGNIGQYAGHLECRVTRYAGATP